MLEVLQQATGVKMLHVPYKSGAESLTAVMSGNTDVTAISAVTATGYIQAGQIRPYAVTSSRRLANLPTFPPPRKRWVRTWRAARCPASPRRPARRPRWWRA